MDVILAIFYLFLPDGASSPAVQNSIDHFLAHLSAAGMHD